MTRYLVVGNQTLDSDVLAVWVVFWGLYRHSKDIQRVQSETYHGYVDLLRGMLADLEREGGELRFNLRLAAIGLTALLCGSAGTSRRKPSGNPQMGSASSPPTSLAVTTTPGAG